MEEVEEEQKIQQYTRRELKKSSRQRQSKDVISYYEYYFLPLLSVAKFVTHTHHHLLMARTPEAPA